MTYVMKREQIEAYIQHLRLEERSDATASRYKLALNRLHDYLPDDKVLTKERLLEWKESLIKDNAPSTVNVMISAVNSFCKYMEWNDLRIKQVKMQRTVYRDPKREMTKAEYLLLLNVALAAGNIRLFYLMQTLAGTGIRISELVFITVEALKGGTAIVNCKGKLRRIFIPKQLCKKLLEYCRERNITSGPVFITRNGTPMSRTNIWRDLRKLCIAANVDPHKVFPHNFRHLFAVTYYRQEKDIAKLADLLGHASINTTRIYIMESGEEHERQMDQMGLVL